MQNGMCKGYNKEEETVDHLFFKCEIFSALWPECLRWWGIQAPPLAECKALFFQFNGLLSGCKIKVEFWELVWLAIIWVIWNHRNRVLFKDKKVDIGEMVEQVKLKTWLWITALFPRFGYPFSLWFANPVECVGYSNLVLNGED